MASYSISIQALQDLRDIVAFKEQYSSRAALNIVEKITQKFQTLAKFPSIGSIKAENLECDMPTAGYASA
ncbi:type II toxin-antitoxin system RelE/ParE family toxin [Floridanema aerugineum]|uniref:Type II toxin-antitoxin system RelE/ParE family toxin n=1 Tax=Floridaenema aerugineum BLCC-F46 TaxID=3153654 RepID=A0ABV4WYD8_9CYAN